MTSYENDSWLISYAGHLEIGEKYIAALERMGEKDNAKLVVLPADLQEAVRGLFGRKG